MRTPFQAVSRRAMVAGAASSFLTGLARPALAVGTERLLRFRPTFDLPHLDPLAGLSTTGLEAANMVFDTLYGLDADLHPQPQMVAGHEVSADSLAWTFTLRDGLLFHDGEAVLAADAVASIDRWMQRDSMGVALKARLVELRVVDDRRFAVRLKRPFPLLLRSLCSITLFVMPARIASGSNAFTPVKEFIGSGPFVFLRQEWVSGSFAAFRRNERYNPRLETPSLKAGSKQVWFDRVEFHTIPDQATAVAALQRGEIDVMLRPTADLIPVLRRSPGVVVDRIDPFGTIYTLMLNIRVPPFDNDKLRHAVLAAASQSDCLQAIAGDEPGMKQTGIGLFTPGTMLASTAGLEAAAGSADLEAARALVRESGYAGEKVVLMVPTDISSLEAAGAVMHRQMSEIGLNVDYQAMDFGTVIQRRARPEVPGGWGAYPSLVDGLAAATPGENYGLLSNTPDPRLRKLVDEWADAEDEAGQKSVADRLQRQFIGAPSYVPLGLIRNVIAYRSGITHLVPFSIMMFWNVRKE